MAISLTDRFVVIEARNGITEVMGRFANAVRHALPPKAHDGEI